MYWQVPQALTCPCATISMNYDTFLHVNYTLHQICNSVFVTQYWFNYLSTSYGGLIVFPDDFRWTGASTFQGLNTFCELVNQTISNRLIQFYSTLYVSASITPLQVFEFQTKALISQFILSTVNEFQLSLSTIQGIIQSNALWSAKGTNYDLYVSSDGIYVTIYLKRYGNCICASSARCVERSNVYNDPNNTILFSVPGIYIGCYVIESLLQSDFRCFYNQTCLNEVQSYLYSATPINVTPLDKSLLVRFFENSTVQELVNELMVEEWNSSTMYESYYNACQPSQCSYTHQTKNDAIYIVTTVIALIGGLITVLKLIVPRLVKFIALCIRKRRVRRVTDIIDPNVTATT
jgi:hypothetical protein